MSQALKDFEQQFELFMRSGQFVISSVVCSISGVYEQADVDGAPPALDFIRKYEGDEVSSLSEFLHKILLASAVDNFNSFLSDLLLEILEKDPRAISGQKFPVKEILSFNSIDDLRKRIVEKYIIDLGYQNIDDLSDTLEKSFGLSALSHWLTKARLKRLIQMRNIIAHNRGVVNQTFLYRSGSKRDVVGDYVWSPHPIHPANYLANLARALDREAVAKFALVDEAKNA